MKSEKRILLVEDDEPTRESILFKLEKAGFGVEVAEDGDEGLKKLREEGPFAAALIDIRLPKGDGFLFLERKRNDPNLAEIPAIVLSNLSQPEFVRRAVELGAAGYMVKAHHDLDYIVGEMKKCVETGKCQVDYRINE